ncbi:MAG: FHA domain-containing protein [Propionibacteriaceae bacterium]|nr:FHA domain-containing protein [Propionibacteriaceae bacterium]
MLECPTCGFANPSGGNFCGRCGARLISSIGDTTHIIQIIDDEARRAEVDIDRAAADVTPGTAVLIVTRGFDSGIRYELDKPSTTVGRSSSCDILLDDITVSRQHATFSINDDGVVITDHGSLNGTYVNRDLINGPAVLKQGDEVQIGKFRMVLLVGDHGTY